MGYHCDFCGDRRSMVYCRSDDACLCLSCDRNVHSANGLSRRHWRTLLCEKCNSHPAVARFVDEKISLCQNCDWSGHGASSSGESHGMLTISSYNGCPSAAVLTSMWSFVLDNNAHLVENSCSSTCELELGQMHITDTDARRQLSIATSKDGSRKEQLKCSNFHEYLSAESNSQCDIVTRP